MAKSFLDSLNKNVRSDALVPREAVSGRIYKSENWTLDSTYKYCPEYSDEVLLYVDDRKNIVAPSEKVYVTQGTNSDFIPFEIPRYYDGFDLRGTSIVIHFRNKNYYDDYSSPINVYYSEDKIRFGWLVDSRATIVDGIVSFEIEAAGTNSVGDIYEWRTKPSDCVSVLKSLQGNGPIAPDVSWVTELIERVNYVSQELSDLKDQISEFLGTPIVRTVNGVAPDENGNVNVAGGGTGTVTSVNGVSPDATGNISIDIPGGTVKSVNGTSPDSSGNVEVEATVDVDEVINALPQTVSLDFTNWDSGSFTETLSDGNVIAHTVTFDDSGNVVSVDGITITGMVTETTEAT